MDFGVQFLKTLFQTIQSWWLQNTDLKFSIVRFFFFFFLVFSFIQKYPHNLTFLSKKRYPVASRVVQVVDLSLIIAKGLMILN